MRRKGFAVTAEEDIRTVLATYERALNADDVELAVSCYTDDGVFMPTTLPTATGPELGPAYTQTFEQIHLAVTFTVDEVAVTGPETAYALTRSNGTQTIRATGEQSDEANREVFIFRADEGVWKIARYMFNKPN